MSFVSIKWPLSPRSYHSGFSHFCFVFILKHLVVTLKSYCGIIDSVTSCSLSGTLEGSHSPVSLACPVIFFFLIVNLFSPTLFLFIYVWKSFTIYRALLFDLRLRGDVESVDRRKVNCSLRYSFISYWAASWVSSSGWLRWCKGPVVICSK